MMKQLGYWKLSDWHNSGDRPAVASIKPYSQWWQAAGMRHRRPDHDSFSSMLGSTIPDVPSLVLVIQASAKPVHDARHPTAKSGWCVAAPSAPDAVDGRTCRLTIAVVAQVGLCAGAR
jgi:hypothetical protein